MIAYLASLDVVVPTFMSILALVLFTPKTKWLAFSTILLSIVAELIPTTINVAALIACISCLGGALFLNYLRTHFQFEFNPALRQR